MKMRKLVVSLAVFAFLLSCAFPPWIETYDRVESQDAVRSQHPIGHALIFDPPTGNRDFGYGIKLDYGMLLIEWAIIGASGALLFYLLGSKKIAK